MDAASTAACSTDSPPSTSEHNGEQRGKEEALGHGAHSGPAARPATARCAQSVSERCRRLTWSERLDVLDAWAQVLDGLYAHLPLKRALYGFDPIRALDHLRQQVPRLSHFEFHRELTNLINHLRDAHTQYSGPRTLTNAVAALPFLVENWGAPEDCHFVVSKVTNRRLVRDRYFVPGVTLDWWNGVPFNRAVDLHGEGETGGRPDSRKAAALESLTLRSLEYEPPP